MQSVQGLPIKAVSLHIRQMTSSVQLIESLGSS